MMRAPCLYLADNLWLIGHDEYTGKGRVTEHTIGLGLAGSLLGELILHGSIDLSPRKEIIVLNRTPLNDVVANTLLTKIIDEYAQPPSRRVTQTRDWLNWLADFSYRWVAQRLIDNGMVTRSETRKMFGLSREVRHCVTDVNNAVLPAVRISTRLAERQPLSAPDLAFAKLALASGLERYLLLDVGKNERDYLNRLLAVLRDSLSSVIAETESAIGDAVLSHRI